MTLDTFHQPIPQGGLMACEETCCVHVAPLEHTPFDPTKSISVTKTNIHRINRNRMGMKPIGTHKAHQWMPTSTRFPQRIDRMGINEAREYLSEMYYGQLPLPATFHGTNLTRDLLPCLQPGTVLYVDLKSVPTFFMEVYPFIPVPFVLLTTDGDESAPGRAHLKYLHHSMPSGSASKLLHWYSSNCDLPAEVTGGQFTCIPLGLSQWDGQRVDLDGFLAGIHGLRYHQSGRPLFPSHVEAARQGLVFLAFETSPKLPDRNVAWAHFCHGDAWQGERRWCVKERLSHRDLYSTAVTFKFAVSPHGGGLDCYRTWESLFLGMIPIVRTSTLDPLYNGLPVLIVSHWEEVTPTLLVAPSNMERVPPHAL